jgi:hypothetical protein
MLLSPIWGKCELGEAPLVYMFPGRCGIQKIDRQKKKHPLGMPFKFNCGTGLILFFF